MTTRLQKQITKQRASRTYIRQCAICCSKRALNPLIIEGYHFYLCDNHRANWNKHVRRIVKDNFHDEMIRFIEKIRQEEGIPYD
jgi:hypothetical protein